MKKVKFNIPERWSQVSNAQLMTYTRLSLLEMEEDARFVLLAINWAGYKVKQDLHAYKHEDLTVVGKNKEFRLQHFQVIRLIESVRWTSENIDGVKAPALRFKSPNTQIYGTMLQQFLIADGAYLAYSKHKDAKYLKILAAVYYGKFHPSLITAKMRTMNLRPHELMAVYLWFTSVKKFIIGKYTYLYSDDSGASPGNVNMKEIALDMLALLNNGHIENNEKIMKTGEIHAALKQINEAARVAAVSRRHGKGN